MTTHFLSHQIKGHGRGKFLGFPTMNLAVPVRFELADGIYAAWVTVEGTRFRGALHWGPIPTFDEKEKSLEVFLIGLDDRGLANADVSQVLVEPVERIRDVVRFDSVDALTRQMEKDVAHVRSILKE